MFNIMKYGLLMGVGDDEYFIVFGVRCVIIVGGGFVMFVFIVFVKRFFRVVLEFVISLVVCCSVVLIL